MNNVDKNIQQYNNTGTTNMNFADMKNKKKSMYDKIIEETNKMQSGEKRQVDDRLWQPEVDKAGNGSALIRFLPPPQGETLPWVRLFSHGFQGPGGWYIENSLTTLGQDDPVSEYNSTLWNRGDDEGKEIARKQKRRLGYVSNIYVIKDPARPEREGNVYLFKYGKKIFDKINDMMHPDEVDDNGPVNPFDLWEGANFRMKIRKVEGYRNYDKSDFANSGPLLDDDDALERIWKSEYALQTFVAPDQFKSYTELKAKLHRVLGMGANGKVQSDSFADDVVQAESTFGSTEPAVALESATDSDDDMSFFKRLADED
jgi:hypothetical protein